MKIFVICATATLAVAAFPWTPVQAAYSQRGVDVLDSYGRLIWCGTSGSDNGPPRERGPGTGPYWSGEPTDCRSIWRRGYYCGTDPDPNIRLQLMRDC
jgi:hypothetical protein